MLQIHRHRYRRHHHPYHCHQLIRVIIVMPLLFFPFISLFPSLSVCTYLYNIRYLSLHGFQRKLIISLLYRCFYVPEYVLLFSNIYTEYRVHEIQQELCPAKHVLCRV